MSASKIHLPLEFDDSIRILELNRFSHSTGLSGRLVPARLGQRPEYFALSYAWGNSEFTESVQLSGDHSHGISQALFGCLKELSTNRTRVKLWVDQICINQHNFDEREDQVRLMAQIYSQAHQVICWLGEATVNSDIGIKFLRVLSLENTRTKQSKLKPLLESLKEGGVRIESGEELVNVNNAAWKGATSLVQRSWFTRLWVVQEAALASTLQFRCGASTISGKSFFGAVRRVASMVTYPQTPQVIMDEFQNAYKLGLLRDQVKTKQYQSYPQLAHELRGWECSDDKDRLNALFGLVFPNTSSAWFTISYKEAVEDVYRSFAFAHITTTKSLGILHFAGDSRFIATYDSERVRFPSVLPPIDNICSWAPDWRIRTRPLPIYTQMHTSQSDQFTATSSKSDYSFNESNRELSIRAVMADEVKHIGPTLVDIPNIPMHSIIKCWFQLAKLAHSGAENIDEMFASTLIMEGRTAVSRNQQHLMNVAEYATCFRCWVESPTDFKDHTQEGGEVDSVTERDQLRRMESATRFGYQAIEICRNRSFFITKNGRFGLGPSQLTIGSPIYLIHGLNVPFLMQKAKKDNQYFLRGECYVRGLMDQKVIASTPDIYITIV